MNRLRYQLKSIRRDKMCLLTFLLPVIVGFAVNLLSGASFQSISETLFGVVQNETAEDTVAWLRQSGTVTQYETIDALRSAVNRFILCDGSALPQPCDGILRRFVLQIGRGHV